MSAVVALNRCGRATGGDCLSRQRQAHRGSGSYHTRNLQRDRTATVLTIRTSLHHHPHANYDAFPDGAHFVFLEPDHSSEMVVVTNWRSVLRARMAGGEAR